MTEHIEHLLLEGWAEHVAHQIEAGRIVESIELDDLMGIVTVVYRKNQSNATPHNRHNPA